MNSNQPFTQDEKSTDISYNNQFIRERNPVLIKDLEKRPSSEDIVKAKYNEVVKYNGR